MRPGSPTLVLLALVLPGCLGAAPEDARDLDAGSAAPAGVPTPPSAPGSPLALAGAAAPSWEVGDWWAFESRDPTGAVDRDTLVVVGKGASGYQTALDNARGALYDALHDISYVGPVSLDLVGAQRGEPVRFFAWPLSDGATWTTTWDGRAVTLVATADPAIRLPDGTVEPGFLVTGTVDGEPFVTYHYVPRLRWWVDVAWASGYEMRLTASGAAYQGPYFEGTGVEHVRAAFGQGVVHEAFDLAEPPTLLEARLSAAAEGPGALLVAFRGPDGVPDPVESHGCPPAESCTLDQRYELPPLAGTWEVDLVNGWLGEATLVVTGATVVEKALGA